MEVIVVDPSGALALQFLYEAGHAHEKMYMIVNAVDGMYKMMAVAADAGQIGVKLSVGPRRPSFYCSYFMGGRDFLLFLFWLEVGDVVAGDLLEEVGAHD